MTQSPELIWYASYGSNISEERFLCYIKGGRPEGASFEYKGCRNKAIPLQQANITIRHELYFAKSSKTWKGGGVAYIHPQANSNASTFGRMYLITKEQFIDVVLQENAQAGKINLDFSTALENGNFSFNSASWYGHLLHLGTKNNHPIYTFTNGIFSEKEINTPDKSYLSTIIRGLIASYNLSDREIKNYFSPCLGIKNRLSQNAFNQLLIETRTGIKKP